jgi:site-specific DNA-methyltransferase (adenine-specific)
MNEIPANSIDLILCDLPYQVSDCHWDSKIPFKTLWKNYNRIKKLHTPIVLFSIQPFTTALIHSNLKQYRYCWYWLKSYVSGFCYARYQPMRRVEDVCVFYDRLPVFNQPLVKCEDNKVITRRQNTDSVFRADRQLNKRYKQELTGYLDNVLYYEGDNMGGVERYHPTQKPVKLLEFLIRVYTKIGATVLDNTMGSGSTGVACVNTSRNFIGIEKETKYFNTKKKRIQEAERLFSTNLFDIETLEGPQTAPCQGEFPVEMIQALRTPGVKNA